MIGAWRHMNWAQRIIAINVSLAALAMCATLFFQLMTVLTYRQFDRSMAQGEAYQPDFLDCFEMRAARLLLRDEHETVCDTSWRESGIETGTAKSEALSAKHESPAAESGEAHPLGGTKGRTA